MPELLPENPYEKEAGLKKGHCGLEVYVDFDPEPNPGILPILLKNASKLYNRGQLAFGVKMVTKEGQFKHRRLQGTVSEAVESEAIYDRKDTDDEGQEPLDPNDSVKLFLFQCRYATSGGNEENNIQPCSADSDLGRVSVIENGELVNKEGMAAELDQEFSEDDSDTFIYAHYLAAAPGNTWDEKIINTHSSGKVEGFHNTAIMTSNAMYLVRDKFASRPFMFGKVKDGGWIAISEDSAIEDMEVEDFKEVGRGQIIKIDENGPRVIKDFIADGDDPGRQTCTMELTYTAQNDTRIPFRDNAIYPDDYALMKDVRFRSGVLVGRRIKDLNVDYYAGVPNSGTTFGKGTAYGAQRRYEDRAITLNPKYSKVRVFQKDDEWDQRDENHRSKLIFHSEYIKGKKIAITEDSTIRGDSGKASVDEFWKAGAEEVHLVIGLSQVDGACHLGISTRTNEELLSYRNSRDLVDIAKELGATSVVYITPEELIQAIIGEGRELVIPDNYREIFKANGLCGMCMGGIAPVDKFGNVYRSTQRELVLV